MTASFHSVSDLAHRCFKRILLVKPSSLGDVVHTLPVLHGLRTRYPQAKIDWLVAPQFAPLLKSHPELDELILFDRKRFGRLGLSAGAASEFLTFIRDLRARRYDLVIDLQGLFRTGFLSAASGAPIRIGFRDAREGAWLFYTHHLHIEDPDTHAVDRNYRVSALLGFEDVPVEFDLALTESVRASARELLRDGLVSKMVRTADPTYLESRSHEQQRFYRSGQVLSGDECIVAVAPGARWETKSWLPERFAQTIDELSERPGVRCVLLGGPDEVELCKRIAHTCRSATINLSGQTSLGELAAVIELATLVLCHDSAAMHLAVALGRPLVCLIGPTNPLRTGPYRRPEDVVRLKLDCAPCYFRRLSQCPHAHRCMRELNVATVLAAADCALAQRAGQPV